jgi:glutathione-independent formaldehyde dehydrogenase
MKAVVYRGKNRVAVEDVPNPKIESPDDAIIRITTAAICGSDPHMFEERSSAEPRTVFGHENMGLARISHTGFGYAEDSTRVVGFGGRT